MHGRLKNFMETSKVIRNGKKEKKKKKKKPKNQKIYKSN